MGWSLAPDELMRHDGSTSLHLKLQAKPSVIWWECTFYPSASETPGLLSITGVPASWQDGRVLYHQPLPGGEDIRGPFPGLTEATLLSYRNPEGPATSRRRDSPNIPGCLSLTGIRVDSVQSSQLSSLERSRYILCLAVTWELDKCSHHNPGAFWWTCM